MDIVWLEEKIHLSKSRFWSLGLDVKCRLLIVGVCLSRCRADIADYSTNKGDNKGFDEVREGELKVTMALCNVSIQAIQATRSARLKYWLAF